MRSLAWLLLPLSFLAATVFAAFLHPSPAGLGTHQALGLPPCFFHHLTGWICPSCGLTTSFSHLVHGHWNTAFATHPLGPVLYLTWGVAGILACLEFFGRPTPLGKFLRGHYAAWAYGAVVIYFFTWSARLIWR